MGHKLSRDPLTALALTTAANLTAADWRSAVYVNGKKPEATAAAAARSPWTSHRRLATERNRKHK